MTVEVVGERGSAHKLLGIKAAAILFAFLIGAVTYLGYLYDRQRSLQLASQLQARGDAVLAALSELTSVARTEAVFLALSDEVGSELTSDIPEALDLGSGIFEYDQPADQLRSIETIRSSPSSPPQAEGGELEMGQNFDPSRMLADYYPPAQPTHIFYCARSRGLRVACSWVAIDTILSRAGHVAGSNLELELRRADGRPLAATSSWSSTDNEFGVVTSSLATVPFTLAAKPTRRLIERENVGVGLVSTLLAYIVIFLAFLPYLLTFKHARKEAGLATELRRQQSLQETLLVTSIDTVATAASLRFFLARPAGEVELFGPWDEESGIEGKSVGVARLFEAIARRDEESVAFHDALLKKAAWSAVLLQHIDGESTHHQANAAPLSNERGYIGLLGVVTNVTKALRAESVESDTRRNQEAQASYLAHMAHEVKGPIVHAQSAMHLLTASIREGDVEKSQRWLGIVSRSIANVSDVVKQALELMRIRQTPSKEQLTAIDLEATTRMVTGSLSQLAANRAQSFYVEVSEGDGKGLTHQGSLVKLLLPLLHNALQYSPEGAAVHVEISTRAHHSRITIEDEGPGVSNSELERLGRPFFRGTQAAAVNVKGHGLGIALALEHARMAGASVSFERSTRKGRGLRATVQIDAVKGSDDAKVAA